MQFIVYIVADTTPNRFISLQLVKTFCSGLNVFQLAHVRRRFASIEYRRRYRRASRVRPRRNTITLVVIRTCFRRLQSGYRVATPASNHAANPYVVSVRCARYRNWSVRKDFVRESISKMSNLSARDRGSRVVH